MVHTCIHNSIWSDKIRAKSYPINNSNDFGCMCDLYISVTVVAEGLSTMQIILSQIIIACMMVSFSGIPWIIPKIILFRMNVLRQQKSLDFSCHSWRIPWLRRTKWTLAWRPPGATPTTPLPHKLRLLTVTRLRNLQKIPQKNHQRSLRRGQAQKSCKVSGLELIQIKN